MTRILRTSFSLINNNGIVMNKKHPLIKIYSYYVGRVESVTPYNELVSEFTALL